MRKLLLGIFSHRTLALLRWDVHFLCVRLRNFVLRKTQPLKSLSSTPKPLYLNLGSGPRGLADPHWINVDGYADENVHYCLDFNKALPFPARSFDGIFCEHVFEHFDLEHGFVLFRQCRRLLAGGGVLRVIVPDGEKIMRTYFDAPHELVARRHPQTGCAMETINSYFRQRYEHQCLYDWALLQHQLERAGFSPVVRVSYQRGATKALLLDDQKYAWESLYVEAFNPAMHGR